MLVIPTSFVIKGGQFFVSSGGYFVMSPDSAQGLMGPGGCVIYGLPDGRQWEALTTKDHWRDPSKIQWIDGCLTALAEEGVVSAATAMAKLRFAVVRAGVEVDASHRPEFLV